MLDALYETKLVTKTYLVSLSRNNLCLCIKHVWVNLHFERTVMIIKYDKFLLTWKKLQIILLFSYILLLGSMLTKTIFVWINIIQCNYGSVELGSTYFHKKLYYFTITFYVKLYYYITRNDKIFVQWTKWNGIVLSEFIM